MCLFCDIRLSTIRDIQQEIAELQQAVRENKEAMRTECTRNEPIEQAHRRRYQREYYLANQERKKAAAKARYYGLTESAESSRQTRGVVRD